MTLEDIPEKFRNDPNLVVYNGQEVHIKLTEKQGDDLAFMVELDDKKESA